MPKVSNYTSYSSFNQYRYINNQVNKVCDILSSQKQELEDKMDSLRERYSTEGTEHLYTDKDSSLNTISISTTSPKTFIEPVQDTVPDLSSRSYNLPVTNVVDPGFSKTIINNIPIYMSSNKTQSISIYSHNPTTQKGGFYVTQQYYNTYLFAVGGETIELLWNDLLKVWTVTNYQGRFTNTAPS
jgi:hypothetical protein